MTSHNVSYFCSRYKWNPIVYTLLGLAVGFFFFFSKFH
jgi:hypothetical protein